MQAKKTGREKARLHLRLRFHWECQGSEYNDELIYVAKKVDQRNKKYVYLLLLYWRAMLCREKD